MIEKKKLIIISTIFLFIMLAITLLINNMNKVSQPKIDYKITYRDEWGVDEDWLNQKYAIEIPFEIKTKEEAVLVIEALIKDLSRKNRKVDQMRIFLFDSKRIEKYGCYDEGIGRVDWAPYGEWCSGKDIKLYFNNDRSKHKIFIEWGETFEKDLEKKELTNGKIR